MGKPVVVFGAAWYAPLPGAFRFGSGISYEEVTAFRPDFTLLRAAIDRLCTHLPVGVVDRHYLAISRDYEPGRNLARLEEVLNHG
jgi:hypothetical protein